MAEWIKDMRLIEADGKALLRRRGLAVPHGRRYGPDEAIEVPPGGAVVKAQLLSGARAKRGLVQLASEAEVPAVAASVLDQMRQMGRQPNVLVEEKVAIEAEYYLAWRIDDVRQAPVMLFSIHGGVEIEDLSEGVHEFVWDPLRGLHPHHVVPFLVDSGADRRRVGVLARFAAELYRMFVAEDAELIEINPLAVTPDGQVMALDAKVMLDDSARFRHRDWSDTLSAKLARMSMTPLEWRAAEQGLTLIEMDGCVA